METTSVITHKFSTTTNNVPSSLEDGQIALNLADRIGFIKQNNGQITKIWDQYQKDETDARYFLNGIIPVSRIGDTPYLPLDVKGDFKGSVVPATPAYVCREPDGSVTGLRPGYNGNEFGMFYFYSPSGRLGARSDIVHTDTMYTPHFLRNDGTVTEYVKLIQNCNQHGFLAMIKSRESTTYQRWYWIFTNGTLDPLFHTYVDVTDTLTNSGLNLTSLQYIREFNGFWGTHGTAIKISFFNNNLPTNQVNVPNPVSTTLTPRSVNCIDPITAATTLASSFLNYDHSNYSAIYKPIDYIGGSQTFIDCSFPVTRQPASADTPRLGQPYEVNYQMSDDGVTLFMWIAYSVYNVYSASGHYITFIVRLRYNTQTNTVSWLLQNTDADNQALPFVFCPPATTVGGGSVGTDDYKRNKYPLLYASNPDGSQMHALTPNTTNFIDPTNVVSVGQTYSFTYFSLRQVSVSNSTAQNKLSSYAERPYLGGNGNYQVQGPALDLTPYDASLIGKRFNIGSFYAQTKFAINTATRRFGQPALVGQLVSAIYPNMNLVRTLDGAAAPNTTAIPTVELLSSVPGITSVPEMQTMGGVYNTIIYPNGDYRIMPYYSQNLMALPATALNGQLIKVINGNTLTYDATRGGAAGIATMPIDLASRGDELVAHFKASSTLDYGSTTTASSWCFHYIGGYSNAGTTYAICLFQYTIQNTIQGTEMGTATLRLVQTGSQMAFSTTATSDIVSTLKNVNASNRVGSTVSATSTGHPVVGILQHTDGRFFIMARNTGRVVVGNTHVLYSMLELASNGTIQRNLPWFIIGNAGWGDSCGVHPDLGAIRHTPDIDKSTARVLLYHWPNTSTVGVQRAFTSFDDALNGGASTVFNLITTESAEGFFVYVTQFAVFLNGRTYQVPTMTIDLTDVIADPSSTTFYVYLKATSASNLDMIVQTTTVPEDDMTMFAGTIVTNAIGISSVNLEKTTRLDLYRPSHEPYVGMSMPIPV